MKKKLIWVLLFLLIIEIVVLGYSFFNLASKSKPSKELTQTSQKLTASSETSASKEKEDPEKDWITSDTEIEFPILMYHSLAESEGNSLKIPPAEFKEHMQWLKDNDYYTLTPQEAYTVLTENKKPAEKIVWITFDDGYLNNYTEGFPILKELGMKATISYITSKLGSEYYFNLDQMKEMAQSDYISIQSHTVSHLDLDSLDDSMITSELKDSKEWLDKELNQDTILLCYPAGRYDDRVEKEAENVGYKMAITTEPGYAKKSDGLYSLKRVRVSPGYDGESFGQFIESFK